MGETICANCLHDAHQLCVGENSCACECNLQEQLLAEYDAQEPIEVDQDLLDEMEKAEERRREPR